MKIKKIADLVNDYEQNFSDLFIDENIAFRLKMATGLKMPELINDLVGVLENIIMSNYNLEGVVENLKYDNSMLKKSNVSLKNKNMQLAIKVDKLEAELETYKKTLHSFSGHDVQRELIHSGKKIAYKEDVNIAKVKEFLDQGYNKTEIAETLGVSRGLVYRRIAKLKEIEQHNETENA